MTRLIIFVYCLFLLSPSTTSNVSSATVPNRARARIIAREAIVATDRGECSAIGSNILKQGGHAVDAAVAAALCQGVVGPGSSGIGGGAFMLVRSNNGGIQAYDMRETAPKLAHENMYGGNSVIKASGPLSIAVPGELLGLHEAWRKYGKLPWSSIVKPAAKIAYNGFKISPYLGMQMSLFESAIMSDKGLRSVFAPNGRLLKSGDLCFRKQLGKTLNLIALRGAMAFYNGSIGINLVNDVKKAGGLLTSEDLNNYCVKLREPIKVNVMGVEIHGMPPPSSGGPAMSLILNILAQYEDLYNISAPLMTHREIEALKHAFAVRMRLGDPDFVNTKDVVRDMLSKEFAAGLKKTIFDNMTFNATHYGGRWNQLNDHGTSHISIIDSNRNAVSMTTTVNAFFGSKFTSQSTGIILNNEMDDFSMPGINSANVLPPSPANFIYPGKRPLSSMSPTIVLKGGKLKAVIGASGGPLIIGGATEVLLNYLIRRMDPLSSVLYPRVYDPLVPNIVLYENWTVPTGQHFEVSADVRDGLKKRGHVLQSLSNTGSVCQFIVVNGRTNLVGVSDPRKGGAPAGY